VDLVVVDSVAALVPRAEIEGEMGDQHMGLQARLMSQALRKLAGTVSKSNATVIFINQIRMKIGVLFGNPETTSGGNALKFYASVRLDVRRVAAIKDGDEVVGNRTRVKVVKNKVAPPFRQAEFDILYNEGISREGDLLDLGVDCGVVEKSGAWYSYGGERVGQGREAARRFLKENPDLRERMAEAVYAARGVKRGVPVEGALEGSEVEAPREETEVE
jgi:recombination protein RecA